MVAIGCCSHLGGGRGAGGLRQSPDSRLLFLGYATLASVACTTVLYDGPTRKANELSVIVSDPQTTMIRIDGRSVLDGPQARFEVAPGPHEVQTGEDRHTPLGTACFVAQPGHLYRIVTTNVNGRVRPSVRDAGSGANVRTLCATAPVPAVDTPTALADSTEAAAPPGQAPPVSHLMAEEKEPAPPILDFRLAVGMTMGGDTLATLVYSNGESKNLMAGDGYTFVLGVAATPLWFGKRNGLGIGGSVGWKYAWLSGAGASLSISRAPIDAWLQWVFRPTDEWYGTLALGTHRDLDISLAASTIDGKATGSMRSRWGFLSELRFYRFVGPHFACGVGLRFVKVDYLSNGESIAASNLGGEFAVHFLF